MEKLLQSGDPAWKQKAQNLCNFTEVVLEYGFLLDPPKTQQLKTLMKELRSCLDRDDESATEKKLAELDKATDDLPPRLNVLMMLIRAIGVAMEKNLVVEADKIRVAKSEIESAFRANDEKRAVEKLSSIEPVLNKVFGSAVPHSTTGDISGKEFLKGGVK